MALKQKKFLIILLIFISALFTLYKLQFETRKEIDKIVKEKVERVRFLRQNPEVLQLKLEFLQNYIAKKK